MTKGIRVIPPDLHMGTEKADIISFTSAPFPFAYDDKWNELSFTSESMLWPLAPSQPMSLYSDLPFSHGWLTPESFTVHSDPSTHL
jgi:hypothetical protein